MRPPLSFFVAGQPATAGSKRGFMHRHTGRVIITEDCKRSEPWRACVQHAARLAMKEARGGGEPELWTGPLRVAFVFCTVRPKGHFSIRGDLNKAGRETPFPTTRPDVLKLARAAEDALTGIVWRDDAQIVTEVLKKRYDAIPGVHITIAEEPMP